MIRKGIIEKLENNGYQARVRIPILDRAKNSLNSTPTDNLRIATICSTPGEDVLYKVGDIVFLGFENDVESNPIILGCLYQSNPDPESSTNISTQSLSVNKSAVLPNDTIIGNFECKNIDYYLTLINSLNERVTKLEQQN